MIDVLERVLIPNQEDWPFDGAGQPENGAAQLLDLRIQGDEIVGFDPSLGPEASFVVLPKLVEGERIADTFRLIADEGVRFVSNLESETAPEYGMRVSIEFAETSGGKAVPVFKAAEV